METVAQVITTMITKQDGDDFVAFSGKGQKFLREFQRVFLRETFVGLTLAFSPDRKFLEKLQKWFSDNMGKRVFIDLTVDENIVGGIVLVCNMRWRDYSLRNLIVKPFGSPDVKL
ncbi:MAG: F0F1 ATP synthase subunit delta [Candidatus Paceibacterales bacterium]